MPTGILGKKIGMTRVFDADGTAIPVTVVHAGPCVVVQRKTTETDGYEAVQVGFEDKKRGRTNSPMTGHFASANRPNVKPKRHLREFGLLPDEELEVGDEVRVDMFEVGQIVDVTGTSKGKGFAGVMKRLGYRGGKASHGSKVHRTPQSAGATDAARVFKNTGRPGQLGNKRVTIRGLKVVRVDAERNLLLIKGHVPGANGGLLCIKARAIG